MVRLLTTKKHRDEMGLFIAEGPKVVGDLLDEVPCHLILATEHWLASHRPQADEVIVITQEELERISQLKTPRDVMGIFYRPKDEGADVADLCHIAAHELTLALDGVQDPGNMGTIIRLADWFGIRHIFCSADSADAFSPKTIMATMGAIARVRIHYVSLPTLLRACDATVPVYGTFLDGTDIYQQDLTDCGIIVMGNEGNGISSEVGALVNRKLFIPSFPPDVPTSESLNVAIATAITCAEFRRPKS